VKKKKKKKKAKEEESPSRQILREWVCLNYSLVVSIPRESFSHIKTSTFSPVPRNHTYSLFSATPTALRQKRPGTSKSLLWLIQKKRITIFGGLLKYIDKSDVLRGNLSVLA
jgi:hypothetical protein